MERPVIAICPGDPAGIGPEVTIKALSNDDVYRSCRPLVICDARVLVQTVKLVRLSLNVNVVDEPDQGKYIPGFVDVMDLKNADPQLFSFGKVSGYTGKASFEYVRTAIELAMEKKVDATVTGPINKEAIHKAGFQFAGHTEIYAHYTGSVNYAMMLAEGSFRVVHVNTHVSMLEAINRITKERVLAVIRLADEALKRMGIEKPRIAVNGLNPHAGENGLFGTEEIKHIIPAIKQAQSEGIHADGPHPPDTIFPKMKGGQYDMVVCMYHDQGHIPVKLLGFRYNNEKKEWEGLSGINITLGLPIVRVSVDHGTAFEIAGQGAANPQSMQQAISYAVKLSKNKWNMNVKADLYQGVIVPMVTPLSAKGNIDESSAVKLITFLQNSGTIPFILGTTGEAASIPAVERHKLIQILIGLKRNGIPAITGMIGLTIPDTVAEANGFFKKGIDAVVITLPYHYYLTENQIYHFYKVLAERIEGDIILYNIPKTVNQSIPLPVIEKLSYEKNVIGIKDSELDKERLIQSLELWRDRKDFFHFTGVNALMPDGIVLGSKGIVPATANFIPHIYVELYKACKAGKKNKIEKMFRETVFWSEIYQNGKTLGESLATLKFIMAELNLSPVHVMPPITEPENNEKIRIRTLLEKNRLKEKLESIDIDN